MIWSARCWLGRVYLGLARSHLAPHWRLNLQLVLGWGLCCTIYCWESFMITFVCKVGGSCMATFSIHYVYCNLPTPNFGWYANVDGEQDYVAKNNWSPPWVDLKSPKKLAREPKHGHISPRIMLTIEPRLVSIFWECGPILF
jgi:hypothetical protein